MDLTGAYVIRAARERVWDALNDPGILARAIPGCEELVKSSPSIFEASATQKIGPVKAKFKGKVSLEDLNPPESYTLRGEGSGGPAGFAKGEARVRLDTVPDGTRLSYEVKANVGGKLAQIGQRLIDQAAKKLADEFFANFSAAVTESAKPDLPVTGATPTDVMDRSPVAAAAAAVPASPAFDWLFAAGCALLVLEILAVVFIV